MHRSDYRQGCRYCSDCSLGKRALGGVVLLLLVVDELKLGAVALLL